MVVMSKVTDSLLRKFKHQEEVINRWRLYNAIHKVEELFPQVDILQALSEQIFFNDLEIMVKERIIHRVWKATLYRFVVAGRQIIQQYPNDKPQVATCVELLLRKCMDYFQKMLKLIEEDCTITQDKFSGHAVFERKDGNTDASYIYNVKDCYIFILILMGDTTRYSYTETGVIRKGMILYDRARGMAPEKGRSYRQLGVVSTKQLDWLGAIYFLTRAHIAQEPDDSREDILDIYDQAYREYKKHRAEYWYVKAKSGFEGNAHGVGRKEIWVNSAALGKIPPGPEEPHNKETHFKNLTDTDILRRFIVAYVHAIGKLYTRIDVDEFDIVAEDALVYFEGLMKKWKGASFPVFRIVQIMAMNMYAVKFTKDKSKLNPKSAYLEITVMNFVMEIFGLMCEKLALIIYLCDWKNPLLEVLSVGVHVWIEWMKNHRSEWSTRRPRAMFSIKRILRTKFANATELEDEVWIEITKLLSRLEVVVLRFSVGLFPVISEQETEVNSVSICPLPECHNLAGFSEFKGATALSKQYFTNNLQAQKRAQIFTRFKIIHEVGTKLMHKMAEKKTIEILDGPYKCKIYKSMVRTLEIRDDREVGGVDDTSFHFNSLENKPPVLKTKYSQLPFSQMSDCSNGHYVILKSNDKKEKKTVKTLDENGEMILPMSKTMKTLESWLYKPRNYKLEVVVEPKRLVIDTNCFVGHMKWVEILLKVHAYQLYIPVSVVLELKGLSKGGVSPKDKLRFASAEKFDILREKIATGFEVGIKCRYALSFIQDHLDHFKIITSTGRTLRINNIRARLKDDFYDRSFSNDERIIDTCRYLEGNDIESRALDNRLRIYRKTVVVTSDRNLRITARSYDLPATTITSLTIWLNSAMLPRPELEQIIQIERKNNREKMRQFIDMKRKQREDQRLATALEKGQMDQKEYNKIMMLRMFPEYYARKRAQENVRKNEI